MGLGDLKRWLDVGGALKKILAAKQKGRATAWGIAGGVVAAFGAKVLITCPDLLSAAPAIVGTAVAAIVAFYTTTPKDTLRKLGKASLGAALGAGWLALCVQFKATCPALVDNWPLLALAALTTFAAQISAAPSQKE